MHYKLFVGQIAIRHVKLEKGTKATDWCMSDGDIKKRIQTQADALTAYQAEVKRTYALSSSVYTKTETQTRENALKSSTISDLKATDDWKKLIKINQNSSDPRRNRFPTASVEIQSGFKRSTHRQKEF